MRLGRISHLAVNEVLKLWTESKVFAKSKKPFLFIFKVIFGSHRRRCEALCGYMRTIYLKVSLCLMGNTNMGTNNNIQHESNNISPTLIECWPNSTQPWDVFTGVSSNLAIYLPALISPIKKALCFVLKCFLTRRHIAMEF